MVPTLNLVTAALQDTKLIAVTINYTTLSALESNTTLFTVPTPGLPPV